MTLIEKYDLGEQIFLNYVLYKNNHIITKIVKLYSQSKLFEKVIKILILFYIFKLLYKK